MSIFFCKAEPTVYGFRLQRRKVTDYRGRAVLVYGHCADLCDRFPLCSQRDVSRYGIHSSFLVGRAAVAPTPEGMLCPCRRPGKLEGRVLFNRLSLNLILSILAA